MQFEYDLMDDNGVSELINIDENVEDKSSKAQQIRNKGKLFISPLKKIHQKKTQWQEDPRINQAFNLLKIIETKKNESSIKDDDSDTYRKYTV